MNDKEIMQTEVEIKQLRNKATALEYDKANIVRKTDEIRKPIIANTVIAGIAHFVGSFISPFIVLGALCFLLINTIIGAVLIFKGEDKEEELQKEINGLMKEPTK